MKLSTLRAPISARLGLARRSLAFSPLLPLLVALALRLLLWGQLPRTGLISDEGEYLSAASWLAHGRGFAWYQGYLWTRAPLYPLFLAAHLRLFGDALTPIYLTQTLLSLVNVVLVYFLAHRPPTTDHRPPTAERERGRGADAQSPISNLQSLGKRGRAGERENGQSPISNPSTTLRTSLQSPMIAALMMALYFPFAIYTQVLLSETLYLTLLLGGFLALAHYPAPDRVPVSPPRTSARQPASNQPPKTDNANHTPPSSILYPLPSILYPHWPLVVGGVLFGLATLTRSLTLFFLPLAALWVGLAAGHGWRRGIGAALGFGLCAAAMVLPWTVYNSRVYGGLVPVDTSGAYNLMLGARAAADGVRLDAPPRNFALALLDQALTPEQRQRLVQGQQAPDGRLVFDSACLLRRQDPRLLDALNRPAGAALPQAQRQRLMSAEGLCLIGSAPGAFVAKSLQELVDLFQINYSGDERFTDGYTTGRLSPWYALGLFLLDDTLYVLVLPLAVIGWALARQGSKYKRTLARITHHPSTSLRAGVSRITFHASRFTHQFSQFSILIGLWWLYNIAVAPLLFAINRFRLPLLPFAFIFAAYALAALRRGGWAALRTRGGLAWGALALALLCVTTAPYAYLQPQPDPAQPEQAQQKPWASYLGPHPSSLDGTWRAITSRPGYWATERLRLALQSNDFAGAEEALRSGQVDGRIATLSRALLAGRQGQYDQGLRILEDLELTRERSYRALASVVRGDLLRSKGERDQARVVLGDTPVDNTNPVDWAWDWLRPAPLPGNHIDLAGNLDLGYIAGCYLGGNDPRVDEKANFRWCTDGARLRFPAAGTGAPQELRLRADGRFWPDDLLPVPPVRVYLGDREITAFTPDHAAVREFSIALPPTPPGEDLVITLRSPTFIPDAADYLKQQGDQAGQARRLAVRLDWAELR